MDPREQVLTAARERAEALATSDSRRLTELLHQDFRWTTHLGDCYDRDEYVSRNTQGQTTWRSQSLDLVDVVVVGDTAILRAEVTDVVHADGLDATFTMPVTQTWVRDGRAWRCLAGHAGPLL